MRTIETRVFTYSELSDSAKSNARDWYRDSSAGDNFFAECVYDDAAEIGDYVDRETDKGEDEITQLLRDFADWIYEQLEIAYDWENSDDNVAEIIEANGYEFTEDGAQV